MDEGYFQHISEHPEISHRDVEILREHLPDARRILDIGCGRGGFVEIAARELGAAAVGLDNAPAAGRICGTQAIPFVLGDALRLPFADDVFDVVRAKEVIEHLRDSRPMLNEVRRVLRPNGLFLAHVPTQFSALYPVGNFWDDYTHIRPLSRSGLLRLLQDTGFAVQLSRGYTAGRNPVERAVGRALALVVPHTWLALGSKEAA